MTDILDVLTTNEKSPISSKLTGASIYTTNRDQWLSWKADSPDDMGEAIFTMLASEDILKREWNTPEEDELWAGL